MMQYFLIKWRQQDGDHEHRDHHVIIAKDQEDADKQVGDMFLYDDEGFDAEDSFVGYGDSETISKLLGVEQITQQDAAVLKRLGI
jgi:hypothetical protein